MKFIFITIIYIFITIIFFFSHIFALEIINGDYNITEDYILNKSLFIKGDLYIINNHSIEIRIETKLNYNITINGSMNVFTDLFLLSKKSDDRSKTEKPFYIHRNLNLYKEIISKYNNDIACIDGKVNNFLKSHSDDKGYFKIINFNKTNCKYLYRYFLDKKYKDEETDIPMESYLLIIVFICCGCLYISILWISKKAIYESDNSNKYIIKKDKQKDNYQEL